MTPSQTTTYNLTLNDDCSTPAVSSSVTIEVVPLPLVDFTIDPTDGCYPHEVYITQLNMDTSLTALWIFGDGGTSQILTQYPMFLMCRHLQYVTNINR